MSARLPFEELAFHRTAIGELVLRRRGVPGLGGEEIYEVRLDDELLMSSLLFDSERALANLAIPETEGTDLDVLVGGLGLGHTAAAALAHDRVRTLTVVELLPEVIAWHEDGLVPLGPELTADPRCRFLEGDFFRLLARTSHGLARFSPDLAAQDLRRTRRADPQGSPCAPDGALNDDASTRTPCPDCGCRSSAGTPADVPCSACRCARLHEKSGPEDGLPAPEGGYAAILVDIDHAPDSWLHPGHGSFYGEKGIRAAAARLAPAGVFAFWSSGRPDPEFTALLEGAFESLETHEIEVYNPLVDEDQTDTIYVARK